MAGATNMCNKPTSQALHAKNNAERQLDDDDDLKPDCLNHIATQRPSQELLRLHLTLEASLRYDTLKMLMTVKAG